MTRVPWIIELLIRLASTSLKLALRIAPPGVSIIDLTAYRKGKDENAAPTDTDCFARIGVLKLPALSGDRPRVSPGRGRNHVPDRGDG